MSPVSPEEVAPRRYGGANGNDITLTEKRTWSNNKVIEFELRNESLHRIQLNLLFFCLTLFLGNLTDSLTLVILSAVALALHCKYITTSIDFDTLLVVESVGIQISSKKIFSGFNSSQFLPWTTVEDVFVNEVIAGGIKTVQRMPGVHVWSLGESDRAGTREAQPTLNVPGSYWLSHKQNIYKFTFKYHESTRNIKEFLYKDELMKVIKRIIKSQPSQGLQSTVHLSVTYKHTFWTRQDKIFAMLKFRNRQDAAVFPQAFMLTISLVEDPESQIDGVLVKSDPDLDSKTSSPIQLLQGFANIPSVEALSENVPQKTEDNENFTRIYNDSNSPNDLTAPPAMSVDTVDCQQSFTRTDSDGFSNASQLLESPTSRRGMNRRRSRRLDTRTISSESNHAEGHNNDLEPGNTLGDVIVGNCRGVSPQEFFINQPYSTSNNSSNSHATVDGTKNGDKRRVGETGIDFESITPRSSDITNQVMEGLMFTIKQVEDNVKVVEQKTKMELDEVLENSEKYETKEGERCLVNSSLLRLENLVTKIEIPVNQSKDPKITDAVPMADSLTLLSHRSVSNHNSLSTAGCFASQSLVQKETNIPISCTSRSPLRSSLRSNQNRNDQLANEVSNTFSPPIGVTDVNLADAGENITKEFHRNLIGHRKRKYVSQRMNGDESMKPVSIENKNMKNYNDSTSGSGDYNDNSDNNNNSKNNDTQNIMNGEVQIDMWKLLQDITRGVKVMVERISDVDIRNATRSSSISVPGTTITGRRILTRSKK